MSSDNENNDVISEDVQQNKIFSVTYQYYGTNNKQEIPDGTEVGWSTQIPNKTYLWIRTVKRYNNGTTTVSNPSPDRNSQYPIDQSSTTVPSDLSRPTPNPVITDEVDDVIGLQVEDLQNQDVSNLISEGQSDNYLQNEAFLSQTEVFNALTDNGQAQGLYRAKDENGKDQIYLNMTYARSGILQVGGSNNELGAFQVLDKDNQIIGYWDKNGIVLTEGEIKSADNSSSWNLKTGELVLNGYVMSYQVEYAIGDSKSTAPQTGWSQNAPAEVEDGKYLWQKSTLVRTGQPTRVTTVCLGKNGIDGTNGRGISSAAVEYCISSSVTDPSGDGVWSEAAPAYQENKYYWTRTRITYTDGITEYSDPALDLALTDANRIAADASAIADVAQRAADQAKADAATAKQNAASAVADAATAKQNAASAVADAAQAKEAANQAQIDADAAAASASSAQTSASNAASSASSAQTSASNAATSASSAQASATSAAEDAAAAREDADDAQSSAEAAATSASAAQTSASNAATSASSAQSSAAAAASSAQVAQSKAEASALSAQAAQVRANDAEAAATSAAENATSALDRARQAAASADSAQTAADNAATSAGDAATSASNAQTAAGNAATSASNAAADAATANQNAAAAVEDARTAKENAAAAKTDAATAKSNAEQAQRDATAANNAATGAVTSLGIVQGVVETLETDVDDLQTHVAMMDAITDEDDNVLVPSGLHVVSTENGYFIVLSNDGMYVYDPQSVLVATYGESISFNSARPQKVGGQDAYLEYYDSNNDGKADALRIVGNKVDITGGAKIYSNNYQASSNPTSPYSASGTFLDLTNGNLYMPNFGVDNVNGQAYINGEIIATGGKLGIDGSQNYWEIDTTKTDYNSNNFASIVGHGNAFIQVGQFQLSDNLFDTRSYDVQAKITYPKYDNTYWDFGIQAPTLNTAASGYVQGIDDNFLYIRNHANTIPSLKQDWNYVFRIDDNGNIYTTGQIYIDGHSLDEIYASQGSGSAYIAKNPVGTWDNTISGNLKVTGSIDGTATKATQLTHWISINGTQWDGSSNLTLGTLNVQYGGTGATTFTAGAALIGNGTGAIQTRTITNNTSSTYVLGSTNLITANTVKYFNGAYDSAHNSNLEYVKHGKLGTVVTHDIDEFITVNGGIIDGSLQVTDLTAGNLVVNGVGRFVNGIYGDLTGTATYATKVKDINNGNDITFAYSKSALTTTSWFAAWNGYELRAISPSTVKTLMSLNNVENTADSAKNVLTATKFSSARTIALTGDTTGSVSGDGSSGWSIATTTSKLHSVGRLTSVNVDNSSAAYTNRVSYFYASSGTTEGKPPTDANILNLAWDSNKWGSQIAIGANSTPHMYIRGNNNSTWDTSWLTILDSNNYTNYTVTKTGSGASGTWGINISGNAATATTATTANSAGSATNATKDASGNVITDTYLKKSGDTMTGNLTFSKPTAAGEKRGFIFSGVTDSAALYYLEPNLQDDGRMRFLMSDNDNDPIEMAWKLYRASGSEIPGEHVVHSFKATGYTLTPIQEADGTYNALSIRPGINDKGTIGNSSYKWNAMYATTFYGALSGNATSAGKINATRAFTIGKTTKNVDWSGAVSFSQAEVSDVASNTANGWMSKEDKAKLDSITVSDIGTVGANSIVGEKDIKVTISQGVATIGHANTAVTAGTASGTATSTLTNGGSFNIPSVTYDAYGHITGKGTTTLTLPNITSITGNAATATKFNSNRTVALTGDVTGSVSGDGSSGWSISTTVGNDSHNHTLGTIVPILSKTYTGVIGTANTFADGSFYYGKIVPNDYYSTWRIKYRIHTYVPDKDGYDMKADVMVSGYQSNLASYSSMNTVAQYYPAYYHELYRATKAGVDNGYGHALGIRLASSYNPTNAGYERTVVIEIMKTENCTFTFFDNMMKYAAIPGTGGTNYSGYTEMNYVSNGLQETGDSDTLDDRQTYFVGKTGSQGIWAGSLFMQVNNGTYENICTASDGTATNSNRTTATTKKANTVGFKVGGKVYYSNSNYNANTNISGWAAVYNQCNAVDSRYAFNTELVANSLTPYEPIYLVGSIASDGLFYLDTVWWTQTPNTTGKIYILVGGCFDSTTSNCRFSLYQHNPWYIYDGTKLVDYSAYAIISDIYAKKSGTIFTGAVNFANGTWNKMGDDCYIGDNNTGGCICIKGANAATGINFVPYSGSTSQKISIDGAGTMTVTGTLAGTFSGNLSGTATKATQDASGNVITSTYLRRDGGNVMTGTLNITPPSGEGGELHLNAATANTTESGIVLDNLHGVFRIFGTASADGVTVTGTGAPLAIDPHAKTITGGYTITGTLSGNASTATKATQDDEGYVIKDTYAKKVSPTFTGLVTSPYYLATTKMTVSGGKVNSSVTTSLPRGGLFADGIAFNSPGTYNDAGWIRILGTGESDTVLEIATGDDGGQTNGTAETIVARQYNASNVIKKELTILDKLGNTEIPGTLTIAEGVTLTWNSSTSSLNFSFAS